MERTIYATQSLSQTIFRNSIKKPDGELKSWPGIQICRGGYSVHRKYCKGGNDMILRVQYKDFNKTFIKGTARKKIDVARAILEFERYIDLRLRTLADEGAKPPHEIKIDGETPGIGSYYSDLTQEDFELIRQRIETNYIESGWEDVYCKKCDDKFIIRLLTIENVAEEDAKKRQSRESHSFIASLKKIIHGSQAPSQSIFRELTCQKRKL
jgi:hypothetical protein